MRIRSFLLSIATLTLFTSSAFATVCQQRTVETPNNAARPYSQQVNAGSAGGQGYAGIPGQNGCPIKAAVGTCPDANESLSEKVGNYLGQFVAYDGNVPDYTQRRIGLQVGPLWIGSDWSGTASAPKTCS